MTRERKGSERYATLPARDLLPVQVSHLRARFELAPQSYLAEAVARMTNEAMEAWEKQHGIERVRPGEMLVTYQGKNVRLPLLDPGTISRLGELRVEAVKRQIEHLELERLQAENPAATVQDVWQLLDQGELARQRGAKGQGFLPEEPISADQLPQVPRRPEPADPPREVLTLLVSKLESDYGCKPAQAEGLVRTAAEIRAWCCPEVSELQPGQVVWLAHGTHRSRRTDPRLFVPVVLTLLTPEEMEHPPSSRAELKRLKMRQLERITAEAWRQDGVLTTVDLEWILHISPGLIRELLEAYQERFGVLLPTAGTVLDMGRTLTHKTIVVEMALQGLSTTEIARRIYHAPSSVDAYLRLFDRVLMLVYYRVPEKAMHRITGTSPALVKEHLELAKKHFPDPDAIKNYLVSRGIKVEELASGV
ncbi:MAG: DUF1670 domain-containing protein [Bacillota bacterium]|nr:DUF1670 domain-containing protein [Bacillota bacterium]